MNMSELKLTNSEMVQQFMTAFGQEIPKKAGFPDEKTIELRVKLNREEEKEFEDAIADNDFPNAIKELCDQLYVVYGAGWAMGVNLDEYFLKVHQNNMEKLGPDGVPIRREDGKILKPEGWKPLDMTKFL